VPVPAGLGGELAEVAGAAGSERYAVFSPGDICPDNIVLSPDGIRFLDFESAGFHSAFRSLLEATEGWQAAELPLYPAFR
jgi:hypothetical protein